MKKKNPTPPDAAENHEVDGTCNPTPSITTGAKAARTPARKPGKAAAADPPPATTLPAVPRPMLTPTGDQWADLRSFIRTTQPTNLLALGEKYLNEPPLEAGQPREQDDKELAVIVVDHLAEEMKEIGWGAAIMKGSPHVYTGSHWQPLHESDFGTKIGDYAEAMGVPPKIARSHQFRRNLLKQFKARLRCEPRIPDPDVVLINFVNGTLEIRNGIETMRETRKNDQLTYELPFPYAPKAKCPMFHKFLDRVLPDPTAQAVLAEFIGWSFIRGLKLEVALLLYGEGSNGKSVFFDIVRAMLGDQNVTTFGLAMLSKMENRFHLGSALLNYASEFKGRCDSDVFKKMVSGEPLEARRLFNDPYVMHEYARLAFNVNELPKDIEHTHGFFRRFLIVPFDQTIGDDEKNPNLAREIIAAELPGVFNWALEGMRRLRQNQRFTECESAKKALTAFKTESDTVGMFLADQGLVPSTRGRMPKNAVYQDYRTYCRTSGFKPLEKNAFGRCMTKRHHIESLKSGSVRSWLLETRVPSDG